MRFISVLVIVGIGLMPASAFSQPFYSQTGEEVPQVELWGEETNGDAIQKDLGFILPKKWKAFDRYRFSSTRADGASVKTWYRTSDSELTLNILIQLRVDVRGVDLGPDFAWQMMKRSAEGEFGSDAGNKPVELSSAPFSLGGRQPSGMERWTRYEHSTGPRVQGMWWQNIGIWSVIITAAGPEARRAEVEAAGNSVIKEMPFPFAPTSAEYLAIGVKLFADMPLCAKDLPEGNGTALAKSIDDAMMFGVIMTGYVKYDPKISPMSPITSREGYCKIETFKNSNSEVTAVRFIGNPTESWDTRYGFAVDAGRNGYFQFDRFAGFETGKDSKIALTWSDSRKAVAYTFFNDWPSYADAKKAVEAVLDTNAAPIVQALHPANKFNVNVDNELLSQPDK